MEVPTESLREQQKRGLEMGADIVIATPDVYCPILS